MTKLTGASPRVHWGPAVALLLTALSCVPGEGPRPPNKTFFAGTPGRPSGGAGIGPAGGSAAVGVVAGMMGTAGTPPSPMAGRGVVAGMVGGTAGTPPPAGTGGTMPEPMPDGGLPPFDGGSDPARNMVSPSEVCERVTTIQCAGEAHCCTNPRRNYETCRSEMLSDCNKNAYFNDLAMNQVTGYDTAYAAGIFAQFEEKAATCDPNVLAWSLQPDGLRGIFQGTVAPMGECRPTGLASLKVYYAALASCKQLATHACLFTGNGPIQAPDTATCVMRTDAGATCFVHTNCKDGLYCANPTEKYSAGKCTPSKAVGAQCSDGVECLTQTCVSGACAMPTAQTAWCLKP